jgi:hypothetical protein
MTTIQSDYYEITFELTDTQLEIILNLYLEWCEKENEEPEISDITMFEEYPNLLDQAIYHAEMIDTDGDLEFLELC